MAKAHFCWRVPGPAQPEQWLVVIVRHGGLDVSVGSVEADPGLFQFGPAVLAMRLKTPFKFEACSLGDGHEGDAMGRLRPQL